MQLSLASIPLLALTAAPALAACPLPQTQPAQPPQGRAAHVPSPRLGGRVWLDRDRDGLQGVGEPGVPGVLVRLLDVHGRATGDETRTDAAGRYAFLGLAEGPHRVAFERPAGRRFTVSDVGSPGFGPASAADDSDLNTVHGAADPSRRGPFETGMRYLELTRLDVPQEPWPVNVWAVYPAVAGSSAAPRARIGDVYLGDVTDMQNNVATSKLATSSTGGDPDDVGLADPLATLQDVEARIDAAASTDGPFPVVMVVSGLLGSAADMLEIGDRLASHGFVALCMESTAFHASVALGGRLATQGGPWVQADFDHVPQAGPADLATLVGWGYTEAGYLTPWATGGASQQSILFADATFTLDQAELWNAQAGHPLEGRMQLERVGWYGYSRGAGAAGPTIKNEERIAFLINCDSGTFVNVPKPMLWIGNANTAPTLGPSVRAQLLGDFHPHYFLIPAITFDPPAAASSFHREYHHAFRDTLVTAFAGHHLRDALAQRDALGLEGPLPTFDGYVGPYVVANQPGWHTPPVQVNASAPGQLDAGLVETPMWVLDANRLASVSSAFLPAGDAADVQPDDHGELLVPQGAALVPLADPAVGLAVDAERRAWFVAGTPPGLYQLDLAAVEGGAQAIAQPLGAVTGLPAPVHGLSWEPRGSRLVAVAGASRHAYAFEAVAGASALDLGALPTGSAAAVDVDLRGHAWVADAAAGGLVRTDLGTGQTLGALAATGGGVTTLAYDELSARLLAVDLGGALRSLDPESGVEASHGDLAALGFGPAAAFAFERRLVARHEPGVRGHVPAPTAGPRPVLEAVSVDAPSAGWDSALLRVQVAEGTGAPVSDVLTLEPGGSVALGATLDVDLPAHSIGQAREVLHDGVHVGWLELDWGLAVGGTRLAPLRVAFTAAADATAVAHVIEALRYDGPLPRRVELTLAGPDSERNLALVVELAP